MPWTKNIVETAIITNENLSIRYYLSDVDGSLIAELSVQTEGNGAHSRCFSCKVQDAVDASALTAAQKTAIKQGSAGIRDYLLEQNDYTES